MASLDNRFFITSSVLDLTIVGLDAIDGETSASASHAQYLKTCSKSNLDLGSVVFLLGYTENGELSVGEGKVAIATDNLIKLSTDGVTWSPGSAGFDVHGNLAFMVCDPMKLATSPNTKSSTTSSSSSSSWKKDLPMQFGIPIPIICDWLNQHWEGNLDDLSKPKLPLIRLMSAGQKSEHSCASFTMRRVFKPTEDETEGTPTSSNKVSKPLQQIGPSSSAVANNSEDEPVIGNPSAAAHVQGIPTPEIYESPKLTSIPVRKDSSTQIQLLDINFPPRITKVTTSPQPARRTQSNSEHQMIENRASDRGHSGPIASIDKSSTGSVNGAASEVQSSSSQIDIADVHHEYSSEGETTMYSAETAESRNYPSPREGRGRIHYVGRSQSCVNYNRWGPAQKHTVTRRTMIEKQRSFMQARKVYSQGAASHRSNDYFSPTVSSIMKKRNSMEQQQKPNPSRQTAAAHSSPRWNF